MKFLRYIRFKSLQFILTITITLITTFAMLFVGITLFRTFSESMERNAAKNNQQIISQVALNLESYIGNVVRVANTLNDKITSNPSLPNESLQNLMNITLSSRKDIVSIALFTVEGELIMSEPQLPLKNHIDITEQQWFSKAASYPYLNHFSTPHVQNLFDGPDNWVVSLSRGVTFELEEKKVFGVLVVDMNFSAIEAVCNTVSLGERGYVYIIDDNENYIYHPQQQLINVGLKKEYNRDVLIYSSGNFIYDTDGELRSVTVNTSYYTYWKLVGVSFMDEIISARRNIVHYIRWSIIFGIIFFLIIGIFVSAKISKPIRELERSMRLVEKGNFDIHINVTGEEEVVKLSNTFNKMVTRIRELMDQIVLEQEAKRKSEFEALQSQINPHFLYNTLDSIVWMAENEKQEDVVTMVTALAKLFRISISKGKNIITVEQEIEHARNYLIIQKIRYKNKFDYEIHVQEEALRYKTLKLILQPVIENSIYHGIEYMVDKGLIKISAEIVHNKLLFTVSDNGLGMPPEVLESLLSKESKSNKGSGVGVKNVHERIQLSFGKEYGLQIESEQEVGTIVKLLLPLIDDSI
ncbi:sensor histidine kinase [Clostridium thermarum]|uniref:sensor histidine kinase n=1 Tax=Clostridium thermarum TaxID=1716543 RepID=UPI00111EDBB9|nr:sensor histidine kinase [Clostridium thermarum]